MRRLLACRFSLAFSRIGVLAGLLAGLGALTACAPPAGGAHSTIGLITSLPIVWRETGAIGDLLKQDGPSHWALGVLGDAGTTLRPIDSLAPGDDGASPLAALSLLIMAQPRALSGPENVALDDWVRGGGRVLLFADPMLTAESAYAIGDRRRPESMAMLSPILRRWGLELEFDDAQPFGEVQVDMLDTTVPVNLPGRFALLPGNDCALLAGGVAARCRIGKGKVLAVADAALFEEGDPAMRTAALAKLLSAADVKVH